jgi:hypothetical protein
MRILPHLSRSSAARRPGKGKVAGLIGMVIGKGMRLEFEAESLQLPEKALRVADPGNRMQLAVRAGQRTAQRAVLRSRQRNAGRPGASRTAASAKPRSPPRFPVGRSRPRRPPPPDAAGARAGARPAAAGRCRRRVRRRPPVRSSVAVDSAAGHRRKRSRHIRGALPARPARRQAGHGQQKPERRCAWPATGVHPRPGKTAMRRPPVAPARHCHRSHD